MQIFFLPVFLLFYISLFLKHYVFPYLVLYLPVRKSDTSQASSVCWLFYYYMCTERDLADVFHQVTHMGPRASSRCFNPFKELTHLSLVLRSGLTSFFPGFQCHYASLFQILFAGFFSWHQTSPLSSLCSQCSLSLRTSSKAFLVHQLNRFSFPFPSYAVFHIPFTVLIDV